MGPINQILILLFSLTGILFGVGLSRIAPEELSPGKKYFVFFRRVLFIVTLTVIVFYLFRDAQFLLLSIFAPIYIGLLIFDFEFKKNIIKDKIKFYNFLYYPLSFIPFILVQDNSFQLTLASLIFLYGFPAGTLLKTDEKNCYIIKK